jgi:hypothetical protein
VSTYLSEPELVEVIGEEATLLLLEARGGTRAYIPATIPAGHWLALAIGPEAAALLAAHLATGRGGGAVELPLGRGGGAALRRRRIHAGLRAGRTANAIARELGLSVRTVRRWRVRLGMSRGSGRGDDT